MIQQLTLQPTTRFTQPQPVRVSKPDTSLIDTFAADSHDRSVSEGITTGAAIGSGFGTILGSIAGGAATIGYATYGGASLGSHFGLIGTIAGGAVGLAGSVLEERFLGAGTKAGALAGFAVGGAVGGVVGGVFALFS